MTTISLEQDELTLADVAGLVTDGPVLVTRQGEPVMAVIALDEAEAEAWLLGKNPELMELVEAARQQLRQEGGISLEDMRRELKL
jgi:PHD/YefM family antitoxin component YafN of YafNO toxin-antitoxin module